MNILKIIPTLSVAGAEKFVVDLANNMALTHKVTIVTLFSSENDFLLRKISNKVEHIDLSQKVESKIKKTFTLYKVVKKLKPDIIHTHLAALIYLGPFLVFGRAKVFHTIHNLARNDAPWLKRFLNKCILKISNVHLVSISEEVNSSIIKEYKSTPFKIENGTTKIEQTEKYYDVIKDVNTLKIDLETKTGIKCQKVLVSIARIDPQKNHELLIKSTPNDGRVLLLLFGHCTSSDSEHAKKIFSLVGCNSHVNYMGVKSNISDYIIYSDGIIFSSDFEGLPISLLESMSAGKVCVSTPAGGIPDVVIDETTGFISDDFSQQAFTKAIERYLSCNDNVLLNMMKLTKYEFEDKYSIDICSKKHIQAYLGVLKK